MNQNHQNYKIIFLFFVIFKRICFAACNIIWAINKLANTIRKRITKIMIQTMSEIQELSEILDLYTSLLSLVQHII